jgi:hypothetical protein
LAIKNGFKCPLIFYCNMMSSYTAIQLRRAYLTFAHERAEIFGKNAFDRAKTFPDDGMYSERMYIHRLIANEIHRLLLAMFVDVKVTMVFTEEDEPNYGTATFTVDWE